MSIWAVSDGRAGIERQSVSLARALAAGATGRTVDIRVVRLAPAGLQTRLRPDLWLNPLAALPADQRRQLVSPWPDVWIATGRRSIAYSRLMRKLSGGRSFVVQIQHPKVDLSAFDLVVPPEHDDLTGENVFPILGPPTWWTDEELGQARRTFAEVADTRPTLLVSLGGDSRTHRLSQAKTEDIAARLRRLAAQGQFLRITVSRRTPVEARERFRALASDVGGRFWESAVRDGPNPYLFWLMDSDAALVTEDSANMLADPAWFGKPIHILRLEGRSDRFDRLHRGFIACGAANWFDGNIYDWKYEPVREAARAAEEILRRLRERRLETEPRGLAV